MCILYSRLGLDAHLSWPGFFSNFSRICPNFFSISHLVSSRQKPVSTHPYLLLLILTTECTYLEAPGPLGHWALKMFVHFVHTYLGCVVLLYTKCISFVWKYFLLTSKPLFLRAFGCKRHSIFCCLLLLCHHILIWFLVCNKSWCKKMHTYLTYFCMKYAEYLRYSNKILE